MESPWRLTTENGPVGPKDQPKGQAGKFREAFLACHGQVFIAFTMGEEVIAYNDRKLIHDHITGLV
jgi:hypothetical protein